MMKRFYLNTDYSFFQKVIPVLGAFGVFGHLGYYFILRFGFGFWESWQMRLAAAFIYLVLIFFPKDKTLSIGQKAFFEFAMVATLPVFFTIFFLKNGANLYWYSSLVFGGLLYGLLTKPYYYVWVYPVSAWITTIWFSRYHPDSQQLVAQSFQAQLVAYFLGMVTSGIKTTMEISHEKIMVTKMALAKAENDLVTAEMTRAAYESLRNAKS
jgi:hypothetical protein